MLLVLVLRIEAGRRPVSVRRRPEALEGAWERFSQPDVRGREW